MIGWLARRSPHAYDHARVTVGRLLRDAGFDDVATTAQRVGRIVGQLALSRGTATGGPPAA